MKRASGILLPLFCLPSEYGIGCISKEAYWFIDQLEKAGQSYWQILPLSPTGYGDSPYQSFSSYAGNPYFIDLEELIAEGLLTLEECKECDFGDDPSYVDYAKLYRSRISILKKAFDRSEISCQKDFLDFCDVNNNWIEDYALFMSLKDSFDGKAWNEWPEQIKLHQSKAIAFYSVKYHHEVEFYKFLQYEFRKQWDRLKHYANQKGIQIIGDIPIYVAYDSADVWSNPELFQFNQNRIPSAVAGCPPDAFSPDGQFWGNPLYDWEKHRQTEFSWWCDRMMYSFLLYDVVRLDHFRGFDEYYSIPYSAQNTSEGHWEKGPGKEFFDVVKKRLGDHLFIAEDLGYLTPSVKRLLNHCGYPGMKVLEFAFDPREKSNYLPHTYDKNCVVYTGTHDNETLVQWYHGLSDESRKFAEEYMGNSYTPEYKRIFDFVRMAMLSCADTCIIPIQDYLELGEEARINKPSSIGNNWKWRMSKDMLSEKVINKIFCLTELSQRFN